MTALRKISSFEKRFQSSPGHLALAYHAAFPLALTPDMLYRLAAYFQEDCQGRPLRIPWIAVADILLSSLCEETDEELYEMAPEVRAELLRRLEADERFGPVRLEQLAAFLLTYARQHLQQHNPALMGSNLATVRESQMMIAQANSTPDRAMATLAAALASADLKNNAALIRLSRLTEVVADATPMQTAEGVEQVRLYAQGLEQIGRRNPDAATRRFAEAAKGRKDIRVGRLTMPIPVQAHHGINFPEFFLHPPLDGKLIVTSGFNARRPESEFPPDVQPNDEGVRLAVRETGPIEGSRRPVIACQRGTIDEVNHDPDYILGRYMRIRHDWPDSGSVSTWYTWYCFLHEIYLKTGDFVLAFQQIAALDSTPAPDNPDLKLIVQHIGAGLGGFLIEDVVDPMPLIWQGEEPPVVDECRVMSIDSLTAQPGQHCLVKASVQNIGRTLWGEGYHFGFAGGEQMDGPDSIDIKRWVEPGEETAVEFSFIAPENPGTYQGVWRPRTPNGFFFPEALTVNVQVAAEMPTMDGLVVEDMRTVDLSGQVSERGYRFEFTWRLRNSGLRPWNNEFTFVRTSPTPLRAGPGYSYIIDDVREIFNEDESSGAELTEIHLGKVEPGGQILLTVPFTAPETAGFFESKWQLFNPEGRAIGERLVVSASVGTATGKTAVGLLLSDTGEVGEQLAQELPLLKPEVIRAFSTLSASMAHRLAAENPKAQWIIHPYPYNSTDPREFVNDTFGPVKVLVDALAGREVWVELHNEPVTPGRPFNFEAGSGQQFAEWFLIVKRMYQEALEANVRFLFPALAPTIDSADAALAKGLVSQTIRTTALRFLDESQAAISEADAIGWHLEWEDSNTLNMALGYLDEALGRFPDKPVWITQANNFTPQLSPEARAQQFIECWRRLQERPQVAGVVFFLGQSRNPSLEPYIWVGKGIAAIVGRRYEDAVGVVEDMRMQLDGTAGIGERVQKEWQIQNICRTIWNSGYRLALIESDGLDGAASFGTSIIGRMWGGGGSGSGGQSKLPLTEVQMNNIAPGEMVRITLYLNVPDKPGAYFQSWQMVNDRGTAFGERLEVDITAVEPGRLEIAPSFEEGILSISVDDYNLVNGNVIGRNQITTYHRLDQTIAGAVRELESLLNERLPNIRRAIAARRPQEGIGAEIEFEGSGPLAINGNLVYRDHIQYEVIFEADPLSAYDRAAMVLLERLIEQLELLERWQRDPILVTSSNFEGEYSGELVLNGTGDGNVTITGNALRAEINGNILNPVGPGGLLTLELVDELLVNGNVYLGDAVNVHFIIESELDNVELSAEPQSLSLDSLRQRVDELEKRVLSERENQTAFIGGDFIDGDIIGDKVEGDMYEQVRVSEDSESGVSFGDTADLFQNPYLFGSPIPPDRPQLFVDRLEIMDAIGKFVLDYRPEAVFFLIGPRRIGKTSILNSLPRFLPGAVITIYIDLQRFLTPQILTELDYYLVSDIIDKLDRAIDNFIPPAELERFKVGPVPVSDSWIKVLNEGLRGRRLLLMFDGWEAFEEAIQDGRVDRSVVELFEALARRGSTIQLLFSGHRDISGGDSSLRGLMEAVTFRRVGNLDLNDARQLIAEPVPDFPVEYSPEAVNSICDLTGGQPYLVQMLCFEVVELVRQRAAETSSNYLWRVSGEDVETVVSQVMKSAGPYFEYLWNEVDSRIQPILTAAAAEPSGSTAPYEFTESMEDRVLFLGFMEQVDGRWRISIELFRRWILINKMLNSAS